MDSDRIPTPDDHAEVMADLRAVIDAAASGKPLDPEVARRVRERADRASETLSQRPGPANFSVQVIREMRGPLDEEQERELTLAQRDLLRKGDGPLKLLDPDTGEEYVLVPVAEYERLRGH